MPKHVGRVWFWRWRRNPLRRRSDVAEAWLGAAAVATLLLTVPVVGVTMADVGERSALDQARGLHHTTAHLAEDAPTTPARFRGTADAWVRAAVRWTGADGSSVTGEAQVASGSKAGSPTTVWLDDTGRVRPTPPTPAQARSQGAALGATAGAGVGLLVAGGWWAARIRLDVRRRGQWERAWTEFDADRGHRHA
ncbi:Rv1733c family protein [Streptomyces sp. YKOK-I1]